MAYTQCGGYIVRRGGAMILDTANVGHLPSGDRGDEMSVSPPRHQWGRAAQGLARQDDFRPHLCGHLDCVVVATHAHYLWHRWRE